MRQSVDWSGAGDVATRDRHSLLLLLSILLFIVVTPLLTETRYGEITLMICVLAILVTATLELSDKRALRGPSFALAAGCTLVAIGGSSILSIGYSC
jgi:predicted ABC-type exoprotein transport system permease subunit